MGNGEWGMGNGELENGEWKMGNGNGKSKIVEIELNFFSGYHHIFWKGFAPKEREFADDKQQTGEGPLPFLVISVPEELTIRY